MFEAAVCKFVKNVGDSHSLIAVPNLDEAADCKTLSIVEKKNRRWCWQSPKYTPSGFTMNELLKQKEDVDDSAGETYQLIKNYEKTNKLCINGKLGAKLKSVLEVEVSGTDSIDVESKFGSITKHEIRRNDLIQLVKGLHFDMSHQKIREVMAHPRKVLCLVHSSLSLAADGTVKTGLEIKASETLSADKGVAGGEADNSIDDKKSRSMVVPAGTLLGYSVVELKINVVDGSFTVVTDPEGQGGFVGEDTGDAAEGPEIEGEEHNEVIARMEDAARDALKQAVLGVAAYPDDIEKMLVMVKDGFKAIEANTAPVTRSQTEVAGRFSCEAEHWQQVLEKAGYTIEGGSVVSPGSLGQDLEAVRYLLEALIELDDEPLVLLPQLQQANILPLLQLLKGALEGKSLTTSDPAVAPVFEGATAAKEFIDALGFKEQGIGSILAPADRRSELEGAWRVLYALWYEPALSSTVNGSWCTVL